MPPVPLALLLFGYALLFPQLRLPLESGAMAVLLLPALGEALLEGRSLYTAILIGWGLLLFGVGFARQRYVLMTGGTIALFLAAWLPLPPIVPPLLLALLGTTLSFLAPTLPPRRSPPRSFAFESERLWWGGWWWCRA